MMIAPFLVVPVAASLVWKHAILNPVYGLINGTITAIWHLFGASNPPQPDWISTFPWRRSSSSSSGSGRRS